MITMSSKSFSYEVKKLKVEIVKRDITLRKCEMEKFLMHGDLTQCKRRYAELEKELVKHKKKNWFTWFK